MISLLSSCAIFALAITATAQFTVCLSEDADCDVVAKCQNTMPDDEACRTSIIDGTYFMLFQDPVDKSVDMELFHDEYCVTPILNVVPTATCIGFSVPDTLQIFVKVSANNQTVPVTTTVAASSTAIPTNTNTSTVQPTASVNGTAPASTTSEANLPERPTGSSAASAQADGNGVGQNTVHSEMIAIVAIMAAAAAQM
ncbi:hypothetical protein SARC_05850 [Sphaeroforma arctica JP610]|uniref:Uncharacterized protein n=1 Tax=Sphaeroforma arctica JP610 TaxID=667725 RepID=A0A0L0FYD6_9EUKA|nr:hypothetical protein SARC_05850 [Sphaeroforma arctica JP610]KNC81845.1 hypothetical protein SARC_05850 [Sphaeroforma arctica JP610]|eukprot:XP_014155747.1 hypothetical protein SARC_05850 [Sphaeroforma arctica JP610]